MEFVVWAVRCNVSSGAKHLISCWRENHPSPPPPPPFQHGIRTVFSCQYASCSATLATIKSDEIPTV
jgi:hypothetical protein